MESWPSRLEGADQQAGGYGAYRRRLLLRAARESSKLEDSGHLLEDGFGSLGGVGGLGDGAAHDEEAGAHLQRLSRCRDPLLVAEGAARRANAWDDQRARGAGEGTERANLLRGADEAANSCGKPHSCKEFHLISGGAADADGAQLGRIQAGEDGDRQEFRRMARAGEGLARSGEHGRAAGGMEGEHVDAERGGRADSSRDGVGDIVELKVEEDAVPAAQDGIEDRRTGGDKELEANFEPGTGIVKPVEEDRGSAGIGNVEGDDEPLAGSFPGVGCGLWPGRGLRWGWGRGTMRRGGWHT